MFFSRVAARPRRPARTTGLTDKEFALRRIRTYLVFARTARTDVWEDYTLFGEPSDELRSYTARGSECLRRICFNCGIPAEVKVIRDGLKREMFGERYAEKDGGDLLLSGGSQKLASAHLALCFLKDLLTSGPADGRLMYRPRTQSELVEMICSVAEVFGELVPLPHDPFPIQRLSHEIALLKIVEPK